MCEEGVWFYIIDNKTARKKEGAWLYIIENKIKHHTSKHKIKKRRQNTECGTHMRLEAIVLLCMMSDKRSKNKKRSFKKEG